MTDETIKKAHPMHEGVKPDPLNGMQLVDTEPKVALLVHEEALEPIWAAYLKAKGYKVYKVRDFSNSELLVAAANADAVVVATGWYVDELSNLLLTLARFLGLEIFTTFGTDDTMSLVQMANPSLNPVTFGQMQRGGLLGG